MCLITVNSRYNEVLGNSVSLSGVCLLCTYKSTNKQIQSQCEIIICICTLFVDLIPNAGEFSIFRLRTRRRESGSIWSKDSVNTVSKIAPIQEPLPMIPIQKDELVLTVTVFHPILKKKDQEFLLLASQPIKALLGILCIKRTFQ